MHTWTEREEVVHDLGGFNVRWCYFTVQAYLKAGDVDNAVAEFKKGKKYITEGKEEDFLYHLKGYCLQEVYREFENKRKG